MNKMTTKFGLQRVWPQENESAWKNCNLGMN